MVAPRDATKSGREMEEMAAGSLTSRRSRVLSSPKRSAVENSFRLSSCTAHSCLSVLNLSVLKGVTDDPVHGDLNTRQTLVTPLDLQSAMCDKVWHNSLVSVAGHSLRLCLTGKLTDGNMSSRRASAFTLR